MMREETEKAVLEHAKAEYPKECCGLIIVVKGKERYVPCANIAGNNEEFIIDPHDYAAAEDQGEVLKIVHSHCNLPPEASQADKVMIEKTQLPWIIVCWPTGEVREFLPEGYEPDLLGREFHHGVLDCYSLVRDYYKLQCGIDIPDFDRQDEWWLKGDDLYLDNFEKAGFVEVPFDEMREHDGLLMQIGSDVINHAAVYLGDNIIIQHCTGRLSSRDVYGGMWMKNTIKVVRHRSLCDA